LPYGEGITISGDLKDFVIKDQAGKTVSLTEWVDVKEITVSYAVAGQAAKKSTAQISGTAWQVSIDALPENTQAGFVFELAGSLSTSRARDLLSNLISNGDFQKAIAEFFATSENQRADVVKKRAQEFLKEILPISARLFPPSLEIKKGTPLSQTFIQGLTDEQLTALANLPGRVKDLAEAGLSVDSKPVSTVGEVLASTQTIKAPSDLAHVPSGQQEGVFKLVHRFNSDYKTLQDALVQDVSASITLDANKQEEAGVQDFQKYAGVDAGAIYIPSVKSLMSYVTFNIYFGSVDETPPHATGVAQFLQQRFSLTLGVAVGDLSGQANSQIKGSNAFLFGLGFRLNKYFRLTAGDAVFRNKVDDKINHGFFVGPSVDISALPNIRNVFGKVKP
jgi:hypothetical protein